MTMENNTTAEVARDVQLSADGKTLAVHVPLQFRRRGGRKVVIAPAAAPGGAQTWTKPQSGVDDALVRTLAQAFGFQRLLDEGHYATVGDLADAKKLDQSFVARILRLTLLAPDIIEAILDGRHDACVQRQGSLERRGLHDAVARRGAGYDASRADQAHCRGGPGMSDDEDDTPGVKLAFEKKTVTVAIADIAPMKMFREGVKASRKYTQILASIRAIGLVEPPVVTADPKNPGKYFLLDGHMRVEALKDLNVAEVECIVSLDDEAYTYNKRINRLAAVQEHKMIVRAVERGVPEEDIAEALGLDPISIRRKFRMLNGICATAIELLKDTVCSGAVFDMLRQMGSLRQVEAAELMIGQNNFSKKFAQAHLAATPERQLAEPARNRPKGASAVTVEQIARMERELANLQTQVKSVEETYGIDNLHLTVAKGYLAKLLGNPRVARWLANNRQEYLGEFQAIAEIEALAAPPIPVG